MKSKITASVRLLGLGHDNKKNKLQTLGKKLLLFNVLFIGFLATAQTIVLPNYNDNLTKDLDNQFVYSEKFNSGTNVYSLKKIDDAGTVTNFIDYTFSTTTTQPTNNGGSGSTVFYNKKNPTYVKGDKAVIRFMQGTTAAHLLYDGTTTSVFNIPNASTLISLHSNFILNTNNAFIFDYSRIYETDYTSGGTSLIFTSPSVKSITTGSIECLNVMQNDGGLYWIDIYNFSKVLYKRIGGVTTQILSVSGGDNLFMHQNKLNGEIYVSKQISSTTNKILLKFDNSGNETYLTTPANAFYGNALCLVNNKLIYATLSSTLISLDLSTNVVANVTTPVSNFIGVSKLITNSSGTMGYTLSSDSANLSSPQYYPYTTDGSTVTQIGGSTGVQVIKGDFCGDNFYLQKAPNSTTFLNEITLLTPTSSSIYFPSSSTSTSYEIGVSNATGIYTKSQQSVSPFAASLYKTTCNNALASTQNTKLNFNISIYPNPTTGNFNLEISEELVGAKVTVNNILGQQIKTFVLDGLLINQNLDAGMYILEIEKEDNKTSRKLIVN